MKSGIITDYEYVVIDPILGEVSCDSKKDAIAYAAKVKGVVHMLTWQGGYIVSRTIFADIGLMAFVRA